MLPDQRNLLRIKIGIEHDNSVSLKEEEEQLILICINYNEMKKRDQNIEIVSQEAGDKYGS